MKIFACNLIKRIKDKRREEKCSGVGGGHKRENLMKWKMKISVEETENELKMEEKLLENAIRYLSFSFCEKFLLLSAEWYWLELE